MVMAMHGLLKSSDSWQYIKMDCTGQLPFVGTPFVNELYFDNKASTRDAKVSKH